MLDDVPFFAIGRGNKLRGKAGLGGKKKFSEDSTTALLMWPGLHLAWQKNE
jgi:hypothetical protein